MCDCRGINPSEEEVQDIINSVDTDYSGKIEWPEFAAALAEKLKPHEDEEESFKETFRVFSKDETGCITADEMKFVLSQVRLTDNKITSTALRGQNFWLNTQY